MEGAAGVPTLVREYLDSQPALDLVNNPIYHADFGKVPFRSGRGAQRKGDDTGEDFGWSDGGRHAHEARKCGGGPKQREVTWHDVTFTFFFIVIFFVPLIIRGVC